MKETYSVPIIERRRITRGDTDKETYHLVLDLEKTPLSYVAGDCIGIYPENDPELVDAILDITSLSGAELVTRKDASHPLREDLIYHANLIKVTKKLGRQGHILEALKERLQLPEKLTAQELADALLPMMPRLYSIASSMQHVGKKAHLTVSLNLNPPGSSARFGTCSHFLCIRAPLYQQRLKVYHHPSPHFVLPEEARHRPIIMVGPGTGIAPFRAFMQERTHKQNWLFFGERHRKTHFYYESEWEEHIHAGKLRLDTAFSRDADTKIYVQDKLLERGYDVWQWLEQGAYLFVCGDAKKMAKDVQHALHQIIERHSAHDPKMYLKQLRQEKRYARDVY